MNHRLPFVALAFVTVASPVAATLPPPPAPHTWVRIGWQCPGHERSFVEIEQDAQGSAGYVSRVVGLTIAGRKIDPTTVEGLNEILARRNFLRPVGGYCERLGENFGIEELASGPKAAEAGWRSFYVAYSLHP